MAAEDAFLGSLWLEIKHRFSQSTCFFKFNYINKIRINAIIINRRVNLRMLLYPDCIVWHTFQINAGKTWCAANENLSKWSIIITFLKGLQYWVIISVSKKSKIVLVMYIANLTESIDNIDLLYELRNNMYNVICRVLITTNKNCFFRALSNNWG